MNDTKHTPGPWRLQWYFGSRSAEIDTESQEIGKYRHMTNQLPMCAGYNSDDVERVTDPETGHEYRYSAEACANARLMVAAPEMCRVLKDIFEHLRGGGELHPGSLIFAEDDPAVRVIQDILAKAEGL